MLSSSQRVNLTRRQYLSYLQFRCHFGFFKTNKQKKYKKEEEAEVNWSHLPLSPIMLISERLILLVLRTMSPCGSTFGPSGEAGMTFPALLVKCPLNKHQARTSYHLWAINTSGFIVGTCDTRPTFDAVQRFHGLSFRHVQLLKEETQHKS